MARKNIELWYEHFKILEEYIKEFSKLPKYNTVYKDFKLGQWLQNQKYFNKKGMLSEECLQALNNLFPYWCSSADFINMGNKSLLLNSDWKSKVPEGGVPIDTVFYRDKLYEFLNKGIFDIETLLLSDIELKLDQYYKCVSKVIPIIEPKYAVLLRVLYGEPVKAPLNELKEFFYSFCISSAEQMQFKMNMMLCLLSARERAVLNMRFALHEDVDHNMTQEEVGEVLGVTRHRARQIEVRALRKLRHPNKLNIIRKAGNFLDDNLLDQKTRATLYRLKIDSKDKILKIIEDDENSSLELVETLKDFIKKYEEREDYKIRQAQIDELLEKPIDILDLNVRPYNCMKRAGISTVRDLVKIMNNEERLSRVRNLGPKSIEDIKSTLDKFGILGLELEDEEIDY